MAYNLDDTLPSRGKRPRLHGVVAIALASLALGAPASGSDGTRWVSPAEAASGSSMLVAARRTVHSGSVEEKQLGGLRCTFYYATWVVDSILTEKGPWKPGDSVRVFDADQADECWRRHEYETKGLNIGLISAFYQSPTMLKDSDAKGARGILIGHLRGKRDLELYCHASIERPDQANKLRILARDSVRIPRRR